MNQEHVQLFLSNFIEGSYKQEQFISFIDLIAGDSCCSSKPQKYSVPKKYQKEVLCCKSYGFFNDGPCDVAILEVELCSKTTSLSLPRVFVGEIIESHSKTTHAALVAFRKKDGIKWDFALVSKTPRRDDRKTTVELVRTAARIDSFTL